MQTLSIKQFSLPACPGPNCQCHDCDNARLLAESKKNYVEGPVLFTTKVGK